MDGVGANQVQDREPDEPVPTVIPTADTKTVDQGAAPAE